MREMESSAGWVNGAGPKAHLWVLGRTEGNVLFSGVGYDLNVLS